jgi:Family of unknown function (DUF5681)
MINSITTDAGLQGENSHAPPPRKVFGRPFKKGQSGNPSGRRKGSVSLTAAVKRNLTRKNADAIARKLIAMAKAGDIVAMRLLFDRLDGAELETRLRAFEQAEQQIKLGR